MDEELTEFCNRLVADGLARPGEVIGCSRSEVDELESEFAIRIPESYRQYLLHMGHSSGQLFAHDHVDSDFSSVQRMNRKARSEHTRLPMGALIIQNRLWEYFAFVLARNKEDSPVFVYSVDELRVVQQNPSVYEWLEMWRKEALEVSQSQRIAGKNL